MAATWSGEMQGDVASQAERELGEEMKLMMIVPPPAAAIEKKEEEEEEEAEADGCKTPTWPKNKIPSPPKCPPPPKKKRATPCSCPCHGQKRARTTPPTSQELKLAQEIDKFFKSFDEEAARANKRRRSSI